MTGSIVFMILLQLFLILLNAVFACAEIAVLSISEPRLEHMAEGGDRKASRLVRLTREPARFLATIQVAITLSGFLGSAFAADNFSEPLVDWVLGLGVSVPRATLDSIAVILITLVLSYFTLVFGELVPKRLAMKRPEAIAMGISGLVNGISVLFKPVVWFLSLSTNGVLRLLGIDPDEAEDSVSEEEIRTLVDAGSEKGTIDAHEKTFIQNVFEFNDICAGEVVTHRTEVEMLWLEDGDESWAETIHRSRHTRYPVCDASPDKVVGILNAKDYFRLNDRSREVVLAQAVTEPFFVTETVKADVLFRTMNQRKQSLAVVLDEYGGMVGIVTLIDLVEELVGELGDEPDSPDDPEPSIHRLSDTAWQLRGNVPLDVLEAATGLSFPAGEYDTLTGLAFDRLGLVPADGSSPIQLSLPGAKLRIARVEAHQVEEATLTLTQKA